MADVDIRIVLIEDFVYPPPISLNSFTASPFSSSVIDVAWVDVNTDTVNYTLERDTNPGFTAPVSITLPGNPSSGSIYSVTGLASGTTYYFRIRANNAHGSSDWVSDSATTP
jgi:hypothetical protein